MTTEFDKLLNSHTFFRSLTLINITFTPVPSRDYIYISLSLEARLGQVICFCNGTLTNATEVQSGIVLS